MLHGAAAARRLVEGLVLHEPGTSKVDSGADAGHLGLGKTEALLRATAIAWIHEHRHAVWDCIGLGYI